MYMYYACIYVYMYICIYVYIYICNQFYKHFVFTNSVRMRSELLSCVDETDLHVD